MNFEHTLKTLSAILPAIRNLDAEFTLGDSVPAQNVDVTEDAATFSGNSHPLSTETRLRLLHKAGAPASYLAKRSDAIQTLLLREHIGQGGLGQTLTPVFRNGEVFTLQGGRLVQLLNNEVVSTVCDALGPNADGLLVAEIDSAADHLSLSLVSPMRMFEPRIGDVVQAGLHIDHSRFGGDATQIHAFILRLVCSNGMMRRECVSAEGIVRTRRMPSDHPRAKELLLDQIRRLTIRIWEKLGQQLIELRTTTERRADVPQLLRQWLQRARISARITDDGEAERRSVMDRLFRAWREQGGAEETYYGAVNALTWVATHDSELSARQRRALSLLGGLLAFSGVHLCPRCFSVLSDPARETHAMDGEQAIAAINRAID